MSPEMIAIAADHAGFELKCALADRLDAKGFDVLDLGTHDAAPVDYPDYAASLAEAIVSGRVSRGVLVCGSGIGMSIAANRVPGIRAALVHDVEAARLARRHNDANVLVMAGRFIATETAGQCLDAFLATEFEGGRHGRRLGKIA